MILEFFKFSRSRFKWKCSSWDTLKWLLFASPWSFCWIVCAKQCNVFLFQHFAKSSSPQINSTRVREVNSIGYYFNENLRIQYFVIVVICWRAFLQISRCWLTMKRIFCCFFTIAHRTLYNEFVPRESLSVIR